MAFVLKNENLLYVIKTKLKAILVLSNYNNVHFRNNENFIVKLSTDRKILLPISILKLPFAHHRCNKAQLGIIRQTETDSLGISDLLASILFSSFQFV